ncbi:hypothetical protein B0H66DRAFT_561356 [Apodospora peruviana]|uniref:Uncharacterized protein n=1 Tax=Apodospora peruviana TaxID=516989 RepID=A0AAE0I2J7_9PEZI|nr:hypothetical protein B0H66DRAFT_561356 [Apodospora peruviana]
MAGTSEPTDISYHRPDHRREKELDHLADHVLLMSSTQELQPTQEQLRAVMARVHAFSCRLTSL